MMADMALAAVIDHSIGVKEGVALLKITKVYQQLWERRGGDGG